MADDINQMSSDNKSKKSAMTMDKSAFDIWSKVPNHNHMQPIAVSSSKVFKNLSMSFYGQQTMKRNKKIIFDDCPDFEEERDSHSAKKNRQSNNSKGSHPLSKGLGKNKPPNQKIANQGASITKKGTNSPNSNPANKVRTFSKYSKKKGNIEGHQKIQKLFKNLKNLKSNHIGLQKEASGNYFHVFDGYMNQFELSNNFQTMDCKQTKILYKRDNKSSTPIRKPKIGLKNIDLSVAEERSRVLKGEDYQKSIDVPNRIKSSQKLRSKGPGPLANWYRLLSKGPNEKDYRKATKGQESSTKKVTL